MSSPTPPEPGPSAPTSASSTKPAVTSTVSSNSKPVPSGSTVRASSALDYTGIPPSLLKKGTWRKYAKWPSKKVSVFLITVSTISYLYYYDRKEVNRLKKEYKEQVEHMAKVPLGNSLEYGRKVKVFAAKWPEDDDYEKGLLHFRRYIKPYLVAAAIDYDVMAGPNYGSITRSIHAEINTRRRIALGLEQPPVDIMSGAPGQLTREQREEREARGGVILVGRHTLKEYTEGLHRGWSGSVDKYEKDKEIERDLEGDGVFETKEDIARREEEFRMKQERLRNMADEADEKPKPAPPSAFGGLLGRSATSFKANPNIQSPLSGSTAVSTIPDSYRATPTTLPPTPAVLVVPWINFLGFKQVPWMIASNFNERYIVKECAEAAMKLILGTIREAEPQSADVIEFHREEENWYKSNFTETPGRVQKQREKYYKEMADRLQKARDLASGARERTKDEETNPLKTEQQLREERLEKEKRWRYQEEGYEIVKPGSEVTWDDRWRGWFKVYDTSDSNGFFEPSA